MKDKTPIRGKISEAVRRIFQEDRWLAAMIREGDKRGEQLLNLRALSRVLKPRVVEELRKMLDSTVSAEELQNEIQESAILRGVYDSIRATKSKSASLESQVLEVVAGTRAICTSDMTTYCSLKSSIDFDKLAKVEKELEGKRDLIHRPIYLIKGEKRVTIVVTKEEATRIENPEIMLADIETELSSDKIFKVPYACRVLVLICPESIMYVPGIIWFFFEILTKNNVNLVEMGTSYNEQIIVLSKEDALRVHPVIEMAIENARESVRRKANDRI